MELLHKMSLKSLFEALGGYVSRTDFEWVKYDEEPHATRRKVILAKYPEIKRLMGCDWRFKWIVAAMVFTQIASFYVLQNVTSFWIYLIAAYFFGGVINHSLTLAIHDISHNQAFGFGRVKANKLFGIFANLPIGIPMATAFRKYHRDHHRYLSIDVLDPDLPTRFEAEFFRTTARKVLWLILQPLFYAIRPLFVNPLKPCGFEYLNTVVQIAFDVLIVITFGWKILLYMMGSTILSMGLHPIAGHFISEHYVMFNENQKSVQRSNNFNVYTSEEGKQLIPDTCSYYGPLNWITFNVGYHVEHHDFPSIPFSRLPEVRRTAPEFYDSLCYHNSWVKVLWRYIFDPSMGPFARVKKPQGSEGDAQKVD